MKAWEVIAYAYNAALHCPDCATTAGMTRESAIDQEGNAPGVVFASDELEPGAACDDCGEALA